MLAYARSKPGPSAEAILAGQTLHPVDDKRWAYCNIKAIDLLAAVLAKDEARKAGADEALFVAPDGTVREGGLVERVRRAGGHAAHPSGRQTTSWTGITRRHVIALAREAGYAVEERAFSPERHHLGRPAGLRGLCGLDSEGHHAHRPGGELTWSATAGRARLTLELLERFRRLPGRGGGSGAPCRIVLTKR